MTKVLQGLMLVLLVLILGINSASGAPKSKTRECGVKRSDWELLIQDLESYSWGQNRSQRHHSGMERKTEEKKESPD